MKLWGGRFKKETSAHVESFHSSINFDQRLYKYDIKGSIAHAGMLGKQGIITPAESEKIIAALKEIEREIEYGKVSLKVEAEDIHMNIEQLLTEKIGETGKKLHTARSRNDQVALDTRMFVKDEIDEITAMLINLQEALVKKAADNDNVIMPGYTHMQKAQPVLFAHHIMAYFEMLQRDIERLRDCRKRVDIMPLGSGALAGTTFPIDRERVRKELNFSQLSRNSMDAVSDRDFIIEFISSASLIMTHLSRFCEELIIWSTNEFAFVEIDDAYATGSSIMPQKKNPDVCELIRGKASRVNGDLAAMLGLMKSLPLAYNKDMQEDKESLFDALDTVKSSIFVFTPMLETLKVNADNMYKGAGHGFTNATDAADYLVTKGMSFREAHGVIGNLVNYCMEQSKMIEELSLDELKNFSELFETDFFNLISLESCVSRRDVYGGTGTRRVAKAIESCREIIAHNRELLE